MRRRIISALFALSLCVTAVSCGGKPQEEPAQADTEAEAETELQTEETTTTAEETVKFITETEFSETETEAPPPEPVRLDYWTNNSPAGGICDHIDRITDFRSDDFIPEGERIAVFDLDGALTGIDFTTDMILWRVLDDDTFEADEAMRETALAVREGRKDASSAAALADEAYAGLSFDEYKELVKRFGESSCPAFSGLKYGRAFYKPMTSLIKYLDDAGFKVYVVSSRDKTTMALLAGDALGLDEERFIAPELCTADEDGMLSIAAAEKYSKYEAVKDALQQPPVFAAAGEKSITLAQYAAKSSYSSLSYVLLRDDEQRDSGNAGSAAKAQQKADEKGVEAVSEKDCFDTIYGYDIIKIVDTKNDEGFTVDGVEIVP